MTVKGKNKKDKKRCKQKAERPKEKADPNSNGAPTDKSRPCKTYRAAGLLLSEKGRIDLKMDSRFKFSGKKLSVAIFVALVVMLAVTVGVLTLALAMQTSVEPTPLPDIEDEQPQQKPSEDKNPLPGDKNDENDKKPSDAPGTGDENDDQQTVSPVPDEPKWSSPVDGYVFKPHSTDELVYSLTLGDYRTHSGIDISANVGSEVKACLDGKINGVYYDGLMGYCISIEHSNGMTSHYKNLGDTLPEGVSEGKDVKSGEVIGYIGESAMVEFSDESHLHFELEVGGDATDPLDYLTYSDKPASPENE